MPAIVPWRGWPFAWRAWIAGLLVMLAAAPFIAWDFCVVQPSMMLYLTAGGLVRQLAREKPVCSACSLELDERVRGGTGIRVKPIRG